MLKRRLIKGGEQRRLINGAWQWASLQFNANEIIQPTKSLADLGETERGEDEYCINMSLKSKKLTHEAAHSADLKLRQVPSVPRGAVGPHARAADVGPRGLELPEERLPALRAAAVRDPRHQFPKRTAHLLFVTSFFAWCVTETRQSS